MTSGKSTPTSQHAAPGATGAPGTELADLAEAMLAIAREIRAYLPAGDDLVHLTMTESNVMRHIDRHPGTTPSATAAATGVARSNLSAALRSLEAKGFVVLSRDETDHRGVHLEATPAAGANLALLRERWAGLLADALDGSGEPAPCLDLLGRLEASLVGGRQDRAPR
ncbi:MAG: winged helix-turn-helix transcriptional regulator [Cellulomonadaceae bacterium]|nr:winged helix-turn-helix transcriptional regulator [Cellulomonadaceae bacterium]